MKEITLKNLEIHIKSNLKLANLAVIEGNYSDALILYHKALVEQPDLYGHIRANIELVKRKIINKKYFDLPFIASLNEAGETKTNHAGGIIGGITNGNEINFKVVVKPTSSTPQEQSSYNWETGMVSSFSIKGRHDLCIALRVPVVLEAVTAIALADLKAIATAVQ